MKTYTIEGMVDEKGTLVAHLGEEVRPGRHKVVVQVEEPSVEDTPDTAESWLDFVAALGKTIPPEELDRLPRDGALNLDHHLYGSPRIEE